MADESKAKAGWVTRAEAMGTLALLTLVIALLAVIVVRQYRTGKGISLVHSEVVADYLVDVNRAEAPELMLLPGIGKARAERILSWRKQHGSFASPGEFRAATGLSEADMTRILPSITLGPNDETPPGPEQFVSPEAN